jgi:hypothetical protein
MQKFLSDPDIQRYISDPAEVMRVDQQNLSKELAEQASWYARFAYLASMAQQQTDTYKMIMEIKFAVLFKKYRDDGLAEKTSTEMAKVEPEYQQARANYIEAEFQEAVIKSAVSGFNQRHQMLVSMAGLLKQEMVTGIRVFEDRAKLPNGGGGIIVS